MKSTLTPVVLWDYCWTYSCALRSLVVTDNIYLDGQSPFTHVHGYTPDISEYINFGWFDWVWYHDPNSPDRQCLGRWLGPSHDIGQGLSYYVLTDKGQVKSSSTVHNLLSSDHSDTNTQRLMSEFTSSMESIIGNHTHAVQQHYEHCTDAPYENIFEEDSYDEHIEPQERNNDGSFFDRPELDLLDSEAPIAESTDNLIGCQVTLPHPSGEMQHATVKSRKRNHDGTLIGHHNENPILNTGLYEVQFSDGTYNEYAANVITENLYEQTDNFGFSHSILSSITDHECDESIAIPKQKSTFILNGITKRRITTRGWKLKVEWKDGSASWIPLKTLKESNPLETAEYAISRGIQDEAAFAWWVPYTIKKRERIIQQTKHNKVKRNIMYGIEVPNSVKEARDLDTLNGNDLWQKSLDKELKNVLVAFKLLQDGESPPVGSKKIKYHIIFTVKMDLTRKARLVADGYLNKHVPNHDCYSTVVSRDSVRIILTIAALNGLSVKSADIGNAYLNAPNKERVHVICGPELFGPEATDKIAVVTRTLYGLKSAGNAWRHHFSAFICDELHFDMTMADNDVYRKPITKPDGTKCYAYLIAYVDDILVCHFDPMSIMKQIQGGFQLKEDATDPNIYLGSDVRLKTISDYDGNNIDCWALGSKKIHQRSTPHLR